MPQSNNQFFQPLGVAFDASHNVYVAADKRVKVYSAAGTYLRTIGAPGTADGQFNGLMGKVFVDATGNTYVSDPGNNRVQVFDNTGAFVRKVGVGPLSFPSGITVDGTGKIYVASQGNNTVQVFQNNGTPVLSFGSAGAATGQFSNPSGVAVDAGGNIYVADVSNNRIQVFDNGGTFVRTFGSVGNGNGQFRFPYDIKLDAAGNIYVADRDNHRVQVFQNNGTFLYQLGSLGYGPNAGNGHFYQAVSLDVDASGRSLVVADQLNNLVQGFGAPEINVKQVSSIASAGTFDFGNVNMLTNSGAISFTIENTGGTSLNLTGTPKVSIGGTNASDFTVNSASTTTPIAPAANSTFTITFTPSASGIRSAQITIASDDFDEASYVINLQGTGVKLVQTITFNSLAPKVFGDPNFDPGATASSTLALTYASSNTAVATVSGNTVTIVGVGSSIITASQPGNGNYNAATDVTQTLSVNTANQSITFNALIAKAFGDPNFDLTATASSNLAVTYGSSNTSVATISGNTVTIVGVGTSTITASQAGNANYNAAANAPQTLTVNKGNQTITFNSFAPASIGDAPITLAPTTTSGLTVVYSSSNTSVATVSGNIVTIVGQGNTTITASQPGNTNYNAATSVGQVLSVKQAQTITFAALSSKTFGDAAFNLTATASSSLVVTYISSNTSVASVSGNTLTIVGAGSTSITANQSGNGTFNAAPPVSQSLTVAKAAQTITFAGLSTKTMGDAPFNLGATSTSALAVQYSVTPSGRVTISGSQITIVAPGSVTISADQPGNANFLAATPVAQTFCINPVKPTISLSAANTETPLLTSNSTSGNQWFLNGTAITGATNATLTVSTAGAYTLQTKADNCTSAMSEQQAIIVTGDLTGENPLEFTIYPNPATTYVDIRGLKGEVGVSQIVDLSGRSIQIVLEKKDDIYRASVAGLSEGLYLLRIQDATTTHQVKFVKK